MNISPNYTMKADFINPFLSSTLNALVDLVSMPEVESSKPMLKIGSQAEGILTGVIDMNGTPVYGSYAVNFSQTLLDEICKRIFKEELKKGVHPLILAKDFVGEFSNVVCGRAKDLLSQRGFSFGLATPRVISGKEHVVEHAVKGPILQVPFNTQWGDFTVETSFCHADHYYAPKVVSVSAYSEQRQAVA